MKWFGTLATVVIACMLTVGCGESDKKTRKTKTKTAASEKKTEPEKTIGPEKKTTPEKKTEPEKKTAPKKTQQKTDQADTRNTQDWDPGESEFGKGGEALGNALRKVLRDAFIGEGDKSDK